MITLVDTPSQVNFSLNPIRLRIRATDSSGVVYGAKPVQRVLLVVGGALQPSDGATITVTVTAPNGTSIAGTLTARTSPNSDGEFLTAPASTQDLMFAQGIAAAINATSALSAFVKAIATSASGGNSSISISVLEVEAGWNIAITVPGGMGFTVQSQTNFVADNTPQNYAVAVELYAEGDIGGSFVEVAALHDLWPDSQGYIELDASSLIHAHIDNYLPDYPMPTALVNTPQINLKQRRFWFRWSERSGTPVTWGTWTRSDIFVAHFGGIDAMIWQEAYWDNTFTETFALLTWCPDFRVIYPSQFIYLSWVNWTTLRVKVRLRIVPYNQDNVAQTTVYAFGTSDYYCEAWQVMDIPAGAGQLGLASNAELKKYTVTVQYYDIDRPAWVDASQTRTYYISREHISSPISFLFLNSMGAPESAVAVGFWAKEMEISRTIAVRNRPFYYSPMRPDIVQTSVVGNTPITVRSGYISHAMAEWWAQELITLNRAWMLRNGMADAVLIGTDRVKMYDKNEILTAIEFVVLRGLKSGVFSDATQAPAILVWGDPDTGDIWGQAAELWGA